MAAASGTLSSLAGTEIEHEQDDSQLLARYLAPDSSMQERESAALKLFDARHEQPGEHERWEALVSASSSPAMLSQHVHLMRDSDEYIIRSVLVHWLVFLCEEHGHARAVAEAGAIAVCLLNLRRNRYLALNSACADLVSAFFSYPRSIEQRPHIPAPAAQMVMAAGAAEPVIHSAALPPISRLDSDSLRCIASFLCGCDFFRVLHVCRRWSGLRLTPAAWPSSKPCAAYWRRIIPWCCAPFMHSSESTSRSSFRVLAFADEVRMRQVVELGVLPRAVKRLGSKICARLCGDLTGPDAAQRTATSADRREAGRSQASKAGAWRSEHFATDPRARHGCTPQYPASGNRSGLRKGGLSRC